jgi:hypothetical protein
MPVILKNNASSTLATAISASDTGIVVADGSKFPSLGASDYFYATLVSPAGTTEIIKVTARVGNSMTVVRAQDGSSANSFQAGALVDMRVNAASIADLRDEAVEISIADVGGYYTSGTVEGALQEAPLYNQGGTSAVTRTVRSRLQDFVSVKDFGAVGNGSTDDTAAVQAAIDRVEALGGNLLFPPGRYLFGSQVTINRTFAPSGSNFVGERNLIISGYGAEIRTTGAITAFDVRGGWIPNHTCLLEGFTIYHRGNTQAVGGIRMIGTPLVTCREVSVVVSSSLPAGYAAFSMENSTPSNPDTGCFWNLIDQCTVRPWSGAEGSCTYGVKLMGAANATTLRNNTFNGSDTHIILMAHPGETYVSNSVNIDGNFFEGPASATAIDIVGTGFLGQYHVSGTRVTNNRFEAIDTAVSLSGTGTTVQLPTYMSGNYADTSVPNYLVNPLDIPVVMLDFALVGSPMGPAKMVNQEGIIVESQDNSYDAITVVPANLGRGIVLQRNDGVNLGSLRYSNSAGGIGMQIAGSLSPYRPLTIKGLRGISQSDTSANNLAGTSSFSASTSRVVSFPVAEADANYLIFLEARANQKLWVSARTTTTFTVESDVSSSNVFGWLLVRQL